MSFKLYTIGHGRLNWGTFLARLQAHEVVALADGRAPASGIPARYRPRQLATICAKAGIDYHPGGGYLRLTRHPEPDYHPHLQDPNYARGVAWLLNLALQTDRQEGPGVLALLGFGVRARTSARHHLVAWSLLSRAPDLLEGEIDIHIEHIDIGGRRWAVRAEHFTG